MRVGTHGAFGANHFLPQRTFFSWRELREAAHGEGWRLVGVAMEGDCDASSVSVDARPFEGPTVFVTTLKGKSLSAEQQAACDAIVQVRVPNPACRPAFVGRRTAALESDVVLSIALHHFASWGRCQANRWVDYIETCQQRPGSFD